jgi:hypothetical protein
VTYDIEQIAKWFTTDAGRLFASLALMTAVYAVRFFPGVVGKYLQLAWQQRALAGLLAAGPALACAISTSVPADELLATSAFAFMSATGLHHMASDVMPALSTGGSKLTDSPEVRAAIQRAMVSFITSLEDQLAKRFATNTFVRQTIKVVDPEKTAKAIEDAFLGTTAKGPAAIPNAAPGPAQDEPTPAGGPPAPSEPAERS